MTTAESTGSGPGRVRRGGLALVMVGALSVSVRGQVEAVTPLLGGMSIVLALTNDLAAFLALNEVITTRRREVRRWAWAVLLLAGGGAAGLNTWHALAAGVLPALWAVVVGIGPVLLAMLLSHLVALVLAADSAAAAEASAPAADVPATDAVPAVPAIPAPSVVEEPPALWPAGEWATAARPAVESARAGQVAGALVGPGGHPALAVVPAPTPRPGPGRGSGVDPRVEQLVAQLRTGAELTGVAVAEQLGCSERTGRRLLRQAADQHAERDLVERRETG